MPRKRKPSRALKLSRAQILAARALSRFRAKPTQARSFVFLGLDGNPKPPSYRGRGVLVYVYRSSKRGHPLKFRPVKEHRKPIVPRSQRSIDVTQTRLKSAIQKRLSEIGFSHTSTERRLRPTKREGRSGINYNRFVSVLAASARSFVHSHASRGSFVIDVSFTVRLPDGSLETHNVRVGFSEAEKQALTGRDYIKILRSKVYRLIAAELSAHGLVTIGSARHIASLSINRGEPREAWFNDERQLWAKRDFDTVSIQAMSFVIRRVKK